jgi:hypothetical protein
MKQNQAPMCSPKRRLRHAALASDVGCMGGHPSPPHHLTTTHAAHLSVCCYKSACDIIWCPLTQLQPACPHQGTDASSLFVADAQLPGTVLQYKHSPWRVGPARHTYTHRCSCHLTVLLETAKILFKQKQAPMCSPKRRSRHAALARLVGVFAVILPLPSTRRPRTLHTC